MAFAIRNLSVLAYANSFTLWHYKAGADSLAAVCNRGFFQDVSDMLMDRDIIMLSAKDGSRIVSVVQVEGGRIDVSPLC